ncbi:MAG: hypothetical protein GY832_26095 [Chloroflexi bacterium]|nr:hypothetical protein [Chloroflexota bacterium]
MQTIIWRFWDERDEFVEALTSYLVEENFKKDYLQAIVTIATMLNYSKESEQAILAFSELLAVCPCRELTEAAQ